MNRKEHLSWAKKRACQIIERNDLTGAFSSFVSDLNKHSETQNHPALELGLMLLASGNLNTPHSMRNHIEGYN